MHTVPAPRSAQQLHLDESAAAAPQGHPPQSGLEKTSLIMLVFPKFRMPGRSFEFGYFDKSSNFGKDC